MRTYDSIFLNYRGHTGFRDMLTVTKGDLCGGVDASGKVMVPLKTWEGHNIYSPNQRGYVCVSYEKDGKREDLVYRDGELIKTFQNRWIATEIYYRDMAFRDSENGLNGMMTIDETVTIPAQYLMINRDGDGFGNGRLLTTLPGPKNSYGDYDEGKCGLRNQDGSQVLPDSYDWMKATIGDNYRVWNGTSYGLFHGDGTERIPVKYSDMRIYTTHCIEVYDGSVYKIVDEYHKTIVRESTESVTVFDSPRQARWGNRGENISDAIYYYEWGEHYGLKIETVLPFCIRPPEGGWATVFANYMTGEVTGELPVRASLVNENGEFAYQADNDRFGIGKIENFASSGLPGGTSGSGSSAPPAQNGSGSSSPTPSQGGNSSAPAQNGNGSSISAPTWGGDAPNPFVDVPSNAYYYNAVLWAVDRSVTNGKTADKFAPGETCTRAQTVTFLWRAAGSPEPASSRNPFTDVRNDAYYTKAVLWAVEQGITNGVTETTFVPNRTVSRGQVVTFLYRSAKASAEEGGVEFTDVSPNAYYYDAVRWAAKTGVTQGTTASTFSPGRECNRGQIVTFLYRSFGKS